MTHSISKIRSLLKHKELREPSWILDKDLQKKVRDNFIVSLAAYIKVGNTEQFVNDLSTITNFFSRLPKDNEEIYSRLVNSTNEYNIINLKMEELINSFKKARL